MWPLIQSAWSLLRWFHLTAKKGRNRASVVPTGVLPFAIQLALCGLRARSRVPCPARGAYFSSCCPGGMQRKERRRRVAEKERCKAVISSRTKTRSQSSNPMREAWSGNGQRGLKKALAARQPRKTSGKVRPSVFRASPVVLRRLNRRQG